MNAHEAFLKAILAEPADDAPRLIYADWLDETGEDPARAEFVRVQVQLSLPTITARMRAELWKREKELLKWNVSRWVYLVFSSPMIRMRSTIMGEQFVLVSLYIDPGESVRFECQFRRGFIEKITCTAQAWSWFGDQICLATPILKVDISGSAPFTRLVRSPRHWPGIDFTATVGAAIDKLLQTGILA
jgi:uncharacterized protein (TIGR02996 family)